MALFCGSSLSSFSSRIHRSAAGAPVSLDQSGFNGSLAVVKLEVARSGQNSSVGGFAAGIYLDLVSRFCVLGLVPLGAFSTSAH